MSMDAAHNPFDLRRTGLRLMGGVIIQTDSRGREIARHSLQDVVAAKMIPAFPPRLAALMVIAYLPFAVSSAVLISSPTWSWLLTGVFLFNAVVPVWMYMIRYLDIELPTGRIRVRVRDPWLDARLFAGQLASVAASKRPPVPYEYKTNAEMTDWDDPSLTVELAMRAHARLERDGAESLNEPERTVLALYELTAEVNGEGFAGWLETVDTAVLCATPQVLERIGLPDVAEIVRKALSPFGEEGVASDPDDRIRQVGAVMEEADDLWTRLEQEYVVMDDEVVKRSLAYAKAHMNEIRVFP